MNEVFHLCQLITMQFSNHVVCPPSFETFWKLKGGGRRPLKHLHVGVGNRLREPRYNSLFLNSILFCLKYLKENVCPVITRRYLERDKQSATSQKSETSGTESFSKELYTYANSIYSKEKSCCTVQSLWIINYILLKKKILSPAIKVGCSQAVYVQTLSLSCLAPYLPCSLYLYVWIFFFIGL